MEWAIHNCRMARYSSCAILRRSSGMTSLRSFGPISFPFCEEYKTCLKKVYPFPGAGCRLLMASLMTGVQSRNIFQENFHHFWIEMQSTVFTHICNCLFLEPRLAVGASTGHSIPYIRDGKDARCQWNGFSLQPARITCAVPSLMVAIRDLNRLAKIWDGRQPIVGKLRVHLHDFPLFFGERTWLEQNAIRNA